LMHILSTNFSIMRNIFLRIKKTPITNCDVNHQKFVTIFLFPFAFFSCKNLKTKHDLQLKANKE
jgi:hypothetical protein